MSTVIAAVVRWLLLGDRWARRAVRRASGGNSGCAVVALALGPVLIAAAALAAGALFGAWS